MVEISTTAQIDSHYRIVIHRQHRDRLGWKDGDEVSLTSDGDKLIIKLLRQGVKNVIKSNEMQEVVPVE
jgi:AbrB family looped-hinge helix DNA binding protein